MTKSSDLYQKLQKHLNKFPIGFPATESGVEIKLLQYLFNEKEAQIAAKLNLIAEPASKIIKRLKPMGIELVDLEVHHTGGEAIQIRGNANHVLIQDCVVHDGDDYSGIDICQWDGGRPHHVTVSGCRASNISVADWKRSSG